MLGSTTVPHHKSSFNSFVIVGFVCLFLFFNSDCSRTCSADQASLELTEIPVPLPPNCWDKRCAPPTHKPQPSFYFVFV